MKKTSMKSGGKKDEIEIFHPDFTVGIGITPIHARGSRAIPPVDELHIALKHPYYTRRKRR